MHGNTESTGDGIKTRRFRKIMNEMELAFDIHRDNESRLGGVHLELTGENVTANMDLDPTPREVLPMQPIYEDHRWPKNLA